MQNKKSSLVVVGTGIKFLSHLTTEARANIEQADKVLYLVNEPAMKEWIISANPNSESLDKVYFDSVLRRDSYANITARILEELNQGKHICVVLYGHPSVFAKPALDAVIEARAKGFDAQILPAVSAEDCLFADLLIDPGSRGCLSLEATDMLIHRKIIDTTCHLILWQVSVIGALGHADVHDNQRGLGLLMAYLLKYYDADHLVYSYVAAQYPAMEPKIEKMKLSELAAASLPRLSTLYVPPGTEPVCDDEMLTSLGISRIK